MQWQFRKWLEWVVLDNRICLFDRRPFGSSDDVLLAESPLSVEGRAEILAAIQELKPKAGGKDFRADGVMDGTGLRIVFSSDGTKGSDDIVLENAWVDVVGHFYETINRFTPPEHRLKFRDIVTSDPDMRHHLVTTRTLKQVEQIYGPTRQTAWWCVWRSFLAD